MPPLCTNDPLSKNANGFPPNDIESGLLGIVLSFEGSTGTETETEELELMKKFAQYEIMCFLQHAPRNRMQ